MESRSLRKGEKAYRIVAHGLPSENSVFSEGHPIWAARKSGDTFGSGEFIPIKDLKPGDYVGYPVPGKNDHEYGHKLCHKELGVFRDQWFWRPVSSIEEVTGVSTVMDLRVDTDHSFCVLGMATKNCYIPVLPLPVGMQTIGGEGRSLLLGTEIRMLLEQLIASMEVPMEFVFSGTSYSASMVSLRQLENLCLGMVEDDRDLVRWLIENLSAYLKLPKPEDFHFKPFKMADDLTRRQVYMALYDRGLASGHVVCAMNDLDYQTEADLRKQEVDIDQELQAARAKAGAVVQGEAQVVAARYAVKAQAAQAQQAKAMQQGPMSGTTPPGGVGGPQNTEQPEPSMDDILPSSGLQPQNAQFFMNGQQMGVNAPEGLQVSPEDLARSVASQLEGVDPAQRDVYLGQMKLETPQLHSLVLQHMTGDVSTIGREPPERVPPRGETPPI